MKKKLLTLVFASFTLLLSAGGWADHRGYDNLPPLHDAASHGDLATVKRLLANGTDVNTKTELGRTPLHRILRNYSWNNVVYPGALEILDLLVKNGADVNAKIGGGCEKTPLLAMWLPWDSQFLDGKASTEEIEFIVKAIDLMVTNGADINATHYPWCDNGTEYSLLSEALFDNHAPVKVVEEIVAHGADLNYQWGSGRRTILEEAENRARGRASLRPRFKAVLAVFNNADELRARKQAQLAGGSTGGDSSTQTEEAKADATPLYSCVSPEEADSKKDKLPTDSKVQYFPLNLGTDLCYNCNQSGDIWNKPKCALFGWNDLESSVYNNCDAPLVVGWCNRENRGDEKCETLDWSYTLEHEDRLQVNHFNFDEDGSVLFAFCYAPQRPKVNP